MSGPNPGGSGRAPIFRDTVVRGPADPTTTETVSRARCESARAPAARARRRSAGRNSARAPCARELPQRVILEEIEPRHVGERRRSRLGDPLRWYRDTRTAWRRRPPVVRTERARSSPHGYQQRRTATASWHYLRSGNRNDGRPRLRPTFGNRSMTTYSTGMMKTPEERRRCHAAKHRGAQRTS